MARLPGTHWDRFQRGYPDIATWVVANANTPLARYVMERVDHAGTLRTDVISLAIASMKPPKSDGIPNRLRALKDVLYEAGARSRPPTIASTKRIAKAATAFGLDDDARAWLFDHLEYSRAGSWHNPKLRQHAGFAVDVTTPGYFDRVTTAMKC